MHPANEAVKNFRMRFERECRKLPDSSCRTTVVLVNAMGKTKRFPIMSSKNCRVGTRIYCVICNSSICPHPFIYYTLSPRCYCCQQEIELTLHI